ncbi:MAG: EamA family transporter, partial [Alphaproteobacteria bacterium]
MSNSVRAILLVIGAAGLAATMHNIVRYLTFEQGLHAFEVAFFRSFFGLIIFVPVIARQGIGLLRTEKLPWHFARGLVNAASMICVLAALALIPVGDVVAISLIGPVFVALLAILFLGEKVGPRRWLGIALAVAGAFVILRPGFVEISLGTMLALASILLVSNSRIMAKMLSRYDSPTTIVAYLTLFMTPITLIPALF